ncbi:probable E3 ubiquitin-protein ligase ARI8 [Miscanthus floridulus]|uniref:probable E3 ubiquitin-protein ligase ARI8 n=1 Tax=Miscanthus floridulus TaxID=154761 RepID=UPI0034583DC2
MGDADNDDGSDDCGGYEYDEDMADGEDDYAFEDTCDYDEVETTEVNADDGEEKEQRYVVLTKVAEILSIPPGFAAVLLRHFKWSTARVQEEWFSDDGRVRAATGLPAEGGLPVPTAVSRAELPCAICFVEHPAGEMRSAGCAHYYCGECWRAYIRAAVDDGAQCPDPSCPAAVVQELVDVAADAKDRERYARFTLRSFVDEGSGAGGGRIKWCRGAGCTRAVEFLGAAGDAADVLCACRHGFCWSCGEEAHRPVSCDTVRAWLDKNASYTETSNWVLANTKHCPRCRLPIEKNQGCMHMTRPPPCAHKFCWVCLDPWDDHTGCGGFRQEENAAADGSIGGQEERTTRRRRQSQSQAAMDMDRYVYHYERWAANYSSLENVFKDMAELESSGVERIAAVAGQPAASFAFLGKAYEQIAHGRRVLKWAYAYGYYLDPARDAAMRCLFEDLLDQANSWLERLHDAAELERRELFCSDAEPAVVRDLLKYYKDKVESYTAATRTFLRNLVKAFETTDLPEFKSLN